MLEVQLQAQAACKLCLEVGGPDLGAGLQRSESFRQMRWQPAVTEDCQSFRLQHACTAFVQAQKGVRAPASGVDARTAVHGEAFMTLAASQCVARIEVASPAGPVLWL